MLKNLQYICLLGAVFSLVLFEILEKTRRKLFENFWSFFFKNGTIPVYLFNHVSLGKQLCDKFNTNCWFPIAVFVKCECNLQYVQDQNFKICNGVWNLFKVYRVLIEYEISSGFKGVLSGLKQFLPTESPLRMAKNIFLFHLKGSFRYHLFVKVSLKAVFVSLVSLNFCLEFLLM